MRCGVGQSGAVTRVYVVGDFSACVVGVGQTPGSVTSVCAWWVLDRHLVL